MQTDTKQAGRMKGHILEVKIRDRLQVGSRMTV